MMVATIVMYVAPKEMRLLAKEILHPGATDR